MLRYYKFATRTLGFFTAREPKTDTSIQRSELDIYVGSVRDTLGIVKSMLPPLSVAANLFFCTWQ